MSKTDFAKVQLDVNIEECLCKHPDECILPIKCSKEGVWLFKIVESNRFSDYQNWYVSVIKKVPFFMEVQKCS